MPDIWSSGWVLRLARYVGSRQEHTGPDHPLLQQSCNSPCPVRDPFAAGFGVLGVALRCAGKIARGTGLLRAGFGARSEVLRRVEKPAGRAGSCFVVGFA